MLPMLWYYEVALCIISVQIITPIHKASMYYEAFWLMLTLLRYSERNIRILWKYLQQTFQRPMVFEKSLLFEKALNSSYHHFVWKTVVLSNTSSSPRLWIQQIAILPIYMYDGHEKVRSGCEEWCWYLVCCWKLGYTGIVGETVWGYYTILLW